MLSNRFTPASLLYFAWNVLSGDIYWICGSQVGGS